MRGPRRFSVTTQKRRTSSNSRRAAKQGLPRCCRASAIHPTGGKRGCSSRARPLKRAFAFVLTERPMALRAWCPRANRALRSMHRRLARSRSSARAKIGRSISLPTSCWSSRRCSVPTAVSIISSCTSACRRRWATGGTACAFRWRVTSSTGSSASCTFQRPSRDASLKCAPRTTPSPELPGLPQDCCMASAAASSACCGFCGIAR